MSAADEAASSASNRARSAPVSSFRPGGGQAPPPPAEPAPTRTANASPGNWSTSVADESQPANSSGGGNVVSRWWGNITDLGRSGETEAPAPAPVPAAAPTPAAAPPKPASPPAAASSSSWSTSTEPQEQVSAGGGESKSRWSRLWGRTAEADATAQPAAAPSAGGAYRLQLATSQTEAEAKALWKKVSQSQSLGGISPQIERVEIGNFGTFYSLRIGPFPDKAESLKVCNALKRSGIDCSLAEQ